MDMTAKTNRKQQINGTDPIVRKTAHTVITSGVLFVLLLYLMGFVLHQSAYRPGIDLSGMDAGFTITRQDGSTETYKENHFPAVQKGETMALKIAPLFEKADFSNATLVFSLYHSCVTVYAGSDLIYQQTEPSQGEMIGHRYYIIPLPNGWQNETIRIVARCAENDTFCSIQSLRILPADRAVYAFHTSHFATGIMLICLLIVSIFMALSSLVTRLLEHRSNGLFSISFLCSAVCLWFMGYTGYLQSFVESTSFLAIVEYVGMYLTPPALSFFVLCHTKSPKIRRCCILLTCFLAAIFVFASIETFAVPGVSYVDYVNEVRILFLVTMVLLLAAEIRELLSAEDVAEQTLHGGMSITIGMSILDLIRFLIFTRLGESLPLLSHSLMPLSILSMSFTVLMYYGVKSTANQVKRIEQENLKRLAYLDRLTGGPNRAFVQKRLDEMAQNGITDFVVTFIDINFLKKTNDTWGHDKGDELIRTAADLLKKHFTGEDFFGRWGGDEFVAVHLGTLEEAKEIMHTIHLEIDAWNADGTHDFALSESWGYGASCKDAPVSPEEAVHLADAQMYEAKQRMHAVRN